MRCRHCDVEMVEGKAIEQTFVPGSVDFPGDEKASTFSAGGPGEVADCLKCPECGHSVSN